MTASTASDQTSPPAGPASSTRRERVGWYMYDWANSAFSTTVISVFLGPYLTAVAQKAASCPTDANGDVACGDRVVHALGIPISPGSLFSYCLSLSVILQVVVLPVVGAIADRSPRKKQ